MKTLISKAISATSTIFAIVIACVVAGLGFAALFYLALLGAVVIGLGLLAAPFVAMTRSQAASGMPREAASAN